MNCVQEVSLHIHYLELALLPILILGNCKMEHLVYLPEKWVKWAKLYCTVHVTGQNYIQVKFFNL